MEMEMKKVAISGKSYFVEQKVRETGEVSESPVAASINALDKLIEEAGDELSMLRSRLQCVTQPVPAPGETMQCSPASCGLDGRIIDAYVRVSGLVENLRSLRHELCI